MSIFNEKKCLKTINTYAYNSENVTLKTRVPITKDDLVYEKMLRCLLYDEFTRLYVDHCLSHFYQETDEGLLLNQAINFIVFCGDV